MKRQFFTTLALTLVAFVTITAQPLPIDPNVRVGVLDNGLTYYIRHNEEPKERVDFHIAQAVGAILEHDDQDGLAHFLEHMAFNGTENFPGKGIINYFESIGVNFGGNINAYTSLDETVYRLSDVPTVREGIIDSALLVMRDWACGLLLEAEEIDSERGVIREEWRTGNTANRRMWRQSSEQKYAGSQYAKRDVIGDTAVINNFAYDALRRYYKEWYGPDLQAIIVVGDIDVDVIEAKIKKLFNNVPARANRGVRPLYELPSNVDPIVSIVADAEAQQSRIQVEYKHKPMKDEHKLSMIGYSTSLCNNLISTMLGYRFEEISQQPSSSFIAAYAGYINLVKTSDAFVGIVIPKEGQETAAYTSLLTELERADRYGFTNAELERAKSDILISVEKLYNERDNRDNIALAQEYINHYLDKEVIPGIEWEYATMKAILPQVSVDVLNQMIKSYITDENMIISFQGPKGEKFPTREQALEIRNSIENATIEAPKEEVINRPLVEKAPKAGKIASITQNDILGTTEWTLKNGIRVIFKPTSFKNDEILLSAYSPGGFSNVETADLPSAMMATAIVEMSGIGDFTNIQLQKLLTGKIVKVSPYINDYNEGISGNSSVKDFETMMQLNYLYFTTPRKDADAFESLKQMYSTSLVNRESNPKTAFNDSIQMTWTSNSPRTQIVNVEWLEKVNHDRALIIYKERFAAPSDFIFMFTGNIDPNDPATKQIILTWLGGLKSNKVTETVKYRINRPEGVVKNHFNRDMQTHTASNRIHYWAPMPFTIKNNLNVRAISDILSIRYLESIREREGGSYGVGTSGYVTDQPSPQAILLMQFDTDPAKQERLMGIIHQEVDDIIKNGPRPDDLQKVKESMLKDLTQDMENNDFWHYTILYRYYVNNMNYVNDYKKEIEAISAQSIQETLKALKASGNIMEVVMFPK